MKIQNRQHCQLLPLKDVGRFYKIYNFVKMNQELYRRTWGFESAYTFLKQNMFR